MLFPMKIALCFFTLVLVILRTLRKQSLFYMRIVIDNLYKLAQVITCLCKTKIRGNEQIDIITEMTNLYKILSECIGENIQLA